VVVIILMVMEVGNDDHDVGYNAGGGRCYDGGVYKIILDNGVCNEGEVTVVAVLLVLTNCTLNNGGGGGCCDSGAYESCFKQWWVRWKESCGYCCDGGPYAWCFK